MQGRDGEDFEPLEASLNCSPRLMGLETQGSGSPPLIPSQKWEIGDSASLRMGDFFKDFIEKFFFQRWSKIRL